MKSFIFAFSLLTSMLSSQVFAYFPNLEGMKVLSVNAEFFNLVGKDNASEGFIRVQKVTVTMPSEKKPIVFYFADSVGLWKLNDGSVHKVFTNTDVSLKKPNYQVADSVDVTSTQEPTGSDGFAQSLLVTGKLSASQVKKKFGLNPIPFRISDLEVSESAGNGRTYAAEKISVAVMGFKSLGTVKKMPNLVGHFIHTNADLSLNIHELREVDDLRVLKTSRWPGGGSQMRRDQATYKLTLLGSHLKIVSGQMERLTYSGRTLSLSFSSKKTTGRHCAARTARLVPTAGK